MTDFVETVAVDVEPRRLFDYLADVDNLPRYMPRLTRATPVGDDGAVEVTATPKLADGRQVEVQGTAWTKVDEPGRTFSWGSQGGRHGYSGSFDIDPADPGSLLTVRLVSGRADADAVRAGLRDTLQSIKRLVEAG